MYVGLKILLIVLAYERSPGYLHQDMTLTSAGVLLPLWLVAATEEPTGVLW